MTEGCIVKRKRKGHYAIVLSERRTDPATGRRFLWQKWIAFRGTLKEAKSKRADLVAAFNRGEFVEPTKMTVGEWLDTWHTESILPVKRAATVERYRGIIDNHLVPELGGIRLQALRPGHLEAYFASKRDGTNTEGSKAKLSNGSLGLHRVVLHSALEKAVRTDLIPRNVVKLLDGVPRVQRQHEDLLARCWTPEEAARVMAAAKASSPQDAAFYAVALECGPRKGEIAGLKWTDVDLDTGTLKVFRTLLKPKGKDGQPLFGPTKTGAMRTIGLSDKAVRLLREHRRTQAELKLANRRSYHDHGLVFAKQVADMTRKHDVLGDAIQINNYGQRGFAKMIAAAKVRRIRFHDMRHTAATLLLQAGVAAKVVQERLGHKKIQITLDVYTHVLPAMQYDAAERVAALLYG